MRIRLLLITLACVVPALARADKPPAITLNQLTLGAALKMAHAALVACRKQGVQASVTVVDRDGVPQVSLRDSLAPPVSLAVSRKKAYTAAMFHATGSVLEAGRAHSPLADLGEGLAFLAGSVPVTAGGRFYGAIGVSGAPQGTTDERCAQAGLQAIRTDLEMQ